MTNLVIIQDNKPMTTSKMVAEAFEKQHKDVLRDIKNLDCSTDFTQRNFAPCLYTSTLANNVARQLPYYNITRDGFTFLAMGYTGKRAAEFKEAYIKAFNDMEQQIRSNLLETKYTLEDLIILQANSIKKLKQEVAEIKNVLPSVAAIPQISPMPIDKDEPMVTVAEYMAGKNYSHKARCFIGVAAKKYSIANNLEVIRQPLGNKYYTVAIEYGISVVSASKKPYAVQKPHEDAKLIAAIKRNPIAQELLKLPVGRSLNYRTSLKAKVKNVIYTKLNKVTGLRFTATANSGWIKITRTA